MVWNRRIQYCFQYGHTTSVKKISKVDHILAIYKWTRLKGYSCSAVSIHLSYSLCTPEWLHSILNMVAQSNSVDDWAC
jgi:hypothetical protein